MGFLLQGQRSKFQGHVGMTWAAISLEQERHRINLVSSKLINWDGEIHGSLLQGQKFKVM